METAAARRAILVLAFVVLIYLVVLYGVDYPVATTGLVTLCIMAVGYFMLSGCREGMTENRGGAVSTDLTDGETPLADEDQYIGSYQNIRTGDIDSMLQRNYSMDLARSADGSVQPSDQIDNSAAIEEAISRGNTVFQPAAQGVSASSSGQLSAFNMGEPGPMSEYSIPLNNRATTVDESVARKQQHRGAQNRKALDGIVRNTKNAYQKYFRNELDENERQEWWSAQSAEVESDFRPPY